MPFDTLLSARAEATPDRAWLTMGDRSWTYLESETLTDRVAAALLADGAQPQDRIAVLSRNTPSFFELSIGAAKARLVVVALNWRLSIPELARIVDDAGPVHLFVSEEYRPAAEELRSRLRGAQRVTTLGAGYEAWRDAVPEGPPSVERRAADDVVFQLYTSGTTGLPKGVMTPRSAAEFALPRVVESWGFSEETVALVPMPLFHIGGIGWALVSAAAGAHLVLLDDPKPGLILDTIAAEGITDIMVVPAQVQMLCDEQEDRPRDLPSLRRITYAASPMPEPLLRRALEVFGVQMHQIYGQTETFAPICQLTNEDHDPVGRPELLRSCGRPVPWAEVALFDPTDGTRVPEGETGEVRIRSTQNMAGYWGRPEETAKALDSEGWLHTGDVGIMRAGYVYLVDRTNDLIISGGENIYPGEIERALLDHPDVEDAAVVGIPSDRWGESPVAAVSLRSDATVDEADLRAYLDGRLAGYKRPAEIRIVEKIDRNITGKIERAKVRSIFLDQHEGARP